MRKFIASIWRTHELHKFHCKSNESYQNISWNSKLKSNIPYYLIVQYVEHFLMFSRRNFQNHLVTVIVDLGEAHSSLLLKRNPAFRCWLCCHCCMHTNQERLAISIMIYTLIQFSMTWRILIVICDQTIVLSRKLNDYWSAMYF